MLQTQSSTRYALTAALGFLLCVPTLQAQRTRTAVRTTAQAADAPMVITSRSVPDAELPRLTRRPAPPRALTTQQKAEIIQQAFPKGLPDLKPTKDPTGLSKPVTLSASQTYVPANTAKLAFDNGDYRAPFKAESGAVDGVIALNAGGKMWLGYRPAQAGAPIMIQCQLGTEFDEETSIKIEPWQHEALVGTITELHGDSPLTFVVLPTDIGWHVVSILNEGKAGLKVYSCTLTPLS